MIAIQTTIDRKAMTTLARVTRKTLRRGRSTPVRTLAWFIVALETFLTVTYLRGGQDGWLVNALLGLFMLGCVLGEDRVNGAIGLRQVAPDSREVNAAFQEGPCYVHRTQAAESWWPYSQIRAAVETENYFVLLLDRSHGQIYDKNGFSWGSTDEFRELIRKQTGLKLQKMK